MSTPDKPEEAPHGEQNVWLVILPRHLHAWKFGSDCPGTQSEEAGKASACEGCPNQTVCAAGLPKGPDPGE